MQFQVPQFIEVEDKIFGPLTIRQFIYIAGGAGMGYICYALLPLILAIPAIGAVGTLTFLLAFYKYNNRPFIYFVESAFKYRTNNRLYIWKKDQPTPKAQEEKKKAADQPKLFVPKLSDSKLKDLTWSLDIRESQNPLTGKDNETNT